MSEARQLGVAIGAGGRHFAAEPPGAYVRLAFAATADPSDLLEAAHRMAE